MSVVWVRGAAPDTPAEDQSPAPPARGRFPLDPPRTEADRACINRRPQVTGAAMHHRTLSWLSLPILLAACSGAPKEPPTTLLTPPPPPAAGTPAREVFDAIDWTADPCVDFYQFSCGNWIATTPLPADKATFTRSFSVIDERNRDLLRTMVEQTAAAPQGPEQEQLASFWKACNDQASIDAAGITPILPEWKAVDALADKKELMALLGRWSAAGDNVLFDWMVDSDPKNPGLAILHVTQGGTGLPERSYYLDEAKKAERDGYRAYLEQLLILAGIPKEQAATDASAVLAFETKLAEVQWRPEDVYDATKSYNKLDKKGLQDSTPGLAWDAWLAGVGRPELTQVNVSTPPFFVGLDALVAATDLPTLKTVLKVKVLSASAGDLAKPLADAEFEFYGKALYGQQQQEERWKQCLEKADGALGHVIAKAYVDRAFAGASKDTALDMIQRIEKAFEAGLPGLVWMDDETRGRAIEKVRAITNKIGYPASWRTYPFEVSPTDHFGNVRRAAANDAKYWAAKAEKPVDADTWFMNPHEVNAYYNPTQNEIAFPAGILQPPFFSADAPRAANFGAMGMVMGHEITHGFDDEGRKYDGTGMMREWWAPEVVEKFETAAQCVVKEYDAFEPLPDLHVNGELTLGENIADLGGARVAYRAYQGWVAEHGAEPEVAGLTADQQFWMSFGQAWCTVASEQVVRVRVQTDPHSPPRYRINGPVVNLPEFAEAFQCAEGTPMNPVESCEVW